MASARRTAPAMLFANNMLPPPRSPMRRPASWGSRNRPAYLLGLFLAAVLGVWAAEQINLPKVVKPVPDQPRTGLEEDIHLNKTPPRQTKGLDLVKMGWTYDCNECHKLIEPRWNYEGRRMVEHETIRLNHGNNRFCLNCHHAKNRNAFVDYDGSEIRQEDVVLLCARCHGTTYRDWQNGAHGRRNGHWNTATGPQTRLRCIQCHDPHDPRFKAMETLAAPVYPARAAGSAHSSRREEAGH